MCPYKLKVHLVNKNVNFTFILFKNISFVKFLIKVLIFYFLFNNLIVILS